MQGQIGKWGNSLALRLPRSLAADVRFHEGTRVDLYIDDGSLVVRVARPKYKLAELLSGEKRRKHKEVDWGNGEGEEDW